MADGPDVGELQSNLIALGDATGLFTAATGHFSALTDDAVRRWQSANGYPTDGQIALGQVVFLPGPVVDRDQGVSHPGRRLTGREPVSGDDDGSSGDRPAEPQPSERGRRGGRLHRAALECTNSREGHRASGQHCRAAARGRKDPPAAEEAPAHPARHRPRPPSRSHPTSRGRPESDREKPCRCRSPHRWRPACSPCRFPPFWPWPEGATESRWSRPPAPTTSSAVTTGVFTGCQVQITGPAIEAGTKVVVAQ